ncbi:Tumor protein p63-regulated 1 protein [Tupaia chinensis]|uniref:Tumor protein p63-regulated 1 protein n=1 Tax=Tupaia chinensis TaxID=246437 RepID=L9JP07_TUPCH|nr:Tumor protein p63-regulated 1 protein [Tupaia chinensis]
MTLRKRELEEQLKSGMLIAARNGSLVVMEEAAERKNQSIQQRQGEGLRIYWGSPEQQSLLSRWNPWSTEVPYATFTEHPMKYTSEKLLDICKLSGFTSKLVPAIQNALKNSAGSGNGKRLTVLTEPILIETYTGLMSFIGNRNKLGYSLARGSIGF